MPPRVKVCEGECVELSAVADGGVAPYQYQWDHGIGEGAGPHQVCPAQSTRYAVRVSDASRDSEFTVRNADVEASADIDVSTEADCADAGMPSGTLRERCSLHARIVNGGVVVQDLVLRQHQSVVAKDGSVVLIATLDGAIEIGPYQLVVAGHTDGFVAKLDADCQLLWAKLVGGKALSTVALNAIAGDHENNVYLGGSFSGDADFGEGLVQAGDGLSGMLLKLDPDGQVAWTKVYSSKYAATSVTDVVVDSQRRVTLVGSTGPGTSFGGAALAPSAVKIIPFLAQLDADGAFRFSETFSSDELVYGLAIGPGDDLWMAGWGVGDVSFGADALSLGPGARYLARLDTDGNERWLHALPRITDPDQWDYWRPALAVDGNGNTFLTRDEPVTRWGDVSLIDDSIEKYDQDGDPAWSVRLSTDVPYETWGHFLALSSGHVLRLGTFAGTAAFSTVSLSSAGDSDVALLEFDREGSLLSHVQLGSPSPDTALGLATGPAGQAFVTFATEPDQSGDDGDLVVTQLTREGVP